MVQHSLAHLTRLLYYPIINWPALSNIYITVQFENIDSSVFYEMVHLSHQCNWFFPNLPLWRWPVPKFDILPTECRCRFDYSINVTVNISISVLNSYSQIFDEHSHFDNSISVLRVHQLHPQLLKGHYKCDLKYSLSTSLQIKITYLLLLWYLYVKNSKNVKGGENKC